MIDDPHTVLLARAFGDLQARPFAWCFDSFDDIDDHVTDSGNMIAAAADETPPPDATPAVTDQEPQEGVTYISSWSELLFEMTNGALGVKPTSPPQH